MTPLETNIYAVIENEYKYSEEEILCLFHNQKESLIYLYKNSYIKLGNNKKIAFTFVGVITISDKVICCFPKYYEGHSFSLSEFAVVIKVLKEFDKEKLIPDSELLSTNEYVNSAEIVIADKILKHYLEYGLFEKRQNIISLNADGDTHWEYTINSTHPLYVKGRPIYHECYNHSVIAENFNLIRELHKYIIKKFYSKYHKILDYDFIFNEDCIIELEQLGSKDYLLSTLQRELMVTYSDRDIFLLRHLIIIINRSYNDSEYNFNLYGTGYFHVVWEKVCSTIFLDQMEDFKRQIPHPYWHNLNSEKEKKSTLIPDIITEYNNSLYVLDAKYYNLEYQSAPFKVAGNPGISDVTKQFLYAQIFRKKYPALYNCFLFPKIIDSDFELAGYVDFALFESFIYVIFLSPQKLFFLFLKKEMNYSFLERITRRILYK